MKRNTIIFSLIIFVVIYSSPLTIKAVINSDSLKSIGISANHSIRSNSSQTSNSMIQIESSIQKILVPYLQTPTPNSIYISWHDSLSTLTEVEYGTTSTLGLKERGTSEILKGSYIWHKVKLSELQSNKEYFYKVMSGSGESGIYSFKTQPAENDTGKIRILLLSDTHAEDTAAAVKIIKTAKRKLQALYGNDIHNQINLVLHSGDLVMTGSEITHWTDQYFEPMSTISPYIPFMTVSGNHEEENRLYYSYMHYDEVKAMTGGLSERFWSFSIGNTQFIGLNSNLSISNGILQNSWLDQELNEIESNSKIDFVFLIVHHPPITELWGEGMNDVGSIYVRNQILPILKKYSKVVQLSYGHTHGFERGTIESSQQNSRGDFRIVCGGGGGGPIDRWGAFVNENFSSIHISLDHYFFQVIEIDQGKKTFESSMYSLGNKSKIRDAELMDKWYRKPLQQAPGNPVAFLPEFTKSVIVFNTSAISSDSIMSVRLQVSDDSNFSSLIVNSLVHWKDTYGVNNNLDPVDLNKDIDLKKIKYDRSSFVNEKFYYYRVQYRDHNLRWSGWSNIVSFALPYDEGSNSSTSDFDLKQNSPNPFNSLTRIVYKIPQTVFVSLKVFDLLGNEIATLVNTEKLAGQYETQFDGTYLSSGVYFYKIQAGDYTQTKKLILMK